MSLTDRPSVNPGGNIMVQHYGHLRNDRRSVLLHRAIAQKLLTSPKMVLAKARGHITVMAQNPRTRRYADLWFRLLDLPIPALAERLTEFSEEMAALRQCTPFAGVLTPQERWQIYRKFREDEQNDSQ